MTNLELRAKLSQAQDLLSDVYEWSKQPHTKFTGMEMNSRIARLTSTADSCINDTLEELKYPNGVNPVENLGALDQYDDPIWQGKQL